MCPHIDEASKFITKILAVLTDPLPHNQNMDLRNIDAENTYGGHQNPLNVEGVHGSINMMSATNTVT